MKKTIFALSLMTAVNTFAATGDIGSGSLKNFITIEKSEAVQYSSEPRTLVISGEDATTLRKLLAGYNETIDTVLAKNAEPSDMSDIRSLKCSDSEATCTLVFKGYAFFNEDTEDYYTPSFNALVNSLAGNQVLLTNRVKQLEAGSKTSYEARILNILMENKHKVPGLKYKIHKPAGLSDPQVNVSHLLYEVELKLQNIQLRCYSSIVTGMGSTNFLHENCSVQAIANVK
ncbi:MAG: hypothetical protein V4654_06865 [Bdellovibrionota bacterium]